MAVSGHNGNNETLIGMSSSIGLSFYDQSMNELEIAQTQNPIKIVIKREQSLPEYSFQYINTTQMNLSLAYLQNAFKLTANSASIHIELKPLDLNVGYLLVLKLGNMPILKYSFSDYTSFKIFCPSKNKLFIFFWLVSKIV
jgi:hypothetical protein